MNIDNFEQFLLNEALASWDKLDKKSIKPYILKIPHFNKKFTISEVTYAGKIDDNFYYAVSMKNENAAKDLKSFARGSLFEFYEIEITTKNNKFIKASDDTRETFSNQKELTKYHKIGFKDLQQYIKGKQ